MQIALATKIKGFNDGPWRTALANRNTVINNMNTSLKEKFRVQMTQAQDAMRTRERICPLREEVSKANICQLLE